MSRYSSDSDSSSYYRQSRRKRRRSPSSSSDSSRPRRSKSSRHSNSSRYKKSSKSYSNRNYRRSRSKNSSRRSKSTSKERYRRSHSREKYRSKYHYKSTSHSRGHSSKYYSRSSSNDSKNSTSSSSSKSSSTSSKKNIFNGKKNISSNSALNPDEQLREKLLKAIKAAESADHQLKQQGVLPKCVKSRNDISNLTPNKPQSEVLKEINADEFVPKAFKSSKQITEENFDDLNIPSSVDGSKFTDIDENSIFHASFFIEPKIKLDRWVKKLYQIRQRAISGEPLQT